MNIHKKLIQKPTEKEIKLLQEQRLLQDGKKQNNINHKLNKCTQAPLIPLIIQQDILQVKEKFMDKEKVRDIPQLLKQPPKIILLLVIEDRGILLKINMDKVKDILKNLPLNIQLEIDKLKVKDILLPPKLPKHKIILLLVIKVIPKQLKVIILILKLMKPLPEDTDNFNIYIILIFL